MYNVDYDSSQLSIGQEKCATIINDVNSVYDTFKSNVNKIIEAAAEFKVDLSPTLTFDSFGESIDGCVTKLKETSDLAVKESELVNRYEQGEFGYEGDSVLVPELYSNINKVNAPAFKRAGATVLMGAFKFGEGFLEFFEGIGDCVLTVSGALCGLAGAEKQREKLKDIAEKEVAVDLFENNSAFEWISENSYFDKDSHFANVCKIAGTATGAIVTGKVTTKVGSSLFEKEKIVEVINKAGTVMHAEGTNVANNLKDGKSLNGSFVFGTMATALSLGLESKVSEPLGEAIGNKVTNSAIAPEINSAVSKAKDVLGEESVETTKEVIKKMSSVSTSEMKNNTSDVVRDGKEESSVDTIAKYAVDAGIDASKKAVETMIP